MVQGLRLFLLSIAVATTLILSSKAAGAAEIIVELRGARVGDVVCVMSAFPRTTAGQKRTKEGEGDLNQQDREEVAPWLERLATSPARHESVAELLRALADVRSPNIRIGARGTKDDLDSSLDWTWQVPVLAKSNFKNMYMRCVRDGDPPEAKDARLILLGTSMFKTTLGRVDVIQEAPPSLNGTSLRFSLTARGAVDEVAVEVLGGSYKPTSNITEDHRTLLYLQPEMTDFEVRLPGPASLWVGAEVIVPASRPAAPDLRTQQGRIKDGLLVGRAAPGAEFILMTRPERPLRVRYRPGTEEFLVEKVTVTWSAPTTIGTLGRKILGCPKMSLVDDAAACCEEVRPAGHATDACVYSCTSGGLPLPARVRYTGPSFEWDDTLAWGRFDSRSFATPAPALVRYPPASEDLENSYVIVADDPSSRGATFPVKCTPSPPLEPRPGGPPEPPMCTRWTNLVTRGQPDDIFYHYYGGARFAQQRVPEADGAYTLKAPRKRSIVFTVKGGVHSRFRIGDGLKPSVGADLGLEFELTSRHWAFVLGPEWRYEPRSIQNGSTAEPSVPSSAIAITGQALLCAPCAGSAPSLGWLGLEVGVAAEYPFLANPQQTGDWTGEPEGGIVYRLQPDHDGIWGMTLLVGAAGDSKFFVNQAAFQGFVGLRTGLAAWLYLN